MITMNIGQIGVLAIVTIALFAFCVVALRLRKGVVNTMDEAMNNIINKFVLTPDSAQSKINTTTGGGSVLRTVQSTAATAGTVAMAGNQISGLVGGQGMAGGPAGPGGDAGGGDGSMSGSVDGTVSGVSGGSAGGVNGVSADVAAGSGSGAAGGAGTGAHGGGGTVVNASRSASSQGHSSTANTMMNGQQSAENSVVNADKNAETNSQNESAVRADSNRYATGIMGGASAVAEGSLQSAAQRDAQLREAGKNMMSFDSLAEASGKNETAMYGAASHARKDVTALGGT